MNFAEVLVSNIDEFFEVEYEFDDLYNYTMNEINFRFDNEHIYLFKNCDEFRCPINFFTSYEMIKLVLHIIEHKLMAENIRTSDNKVLFRNFSGNVILDGPDDPIRVAIWLHVASRDVSRCFDFLNTKYTMNKFKMMLADITDDEKIECAREILVLRNILSKILYNINIDSEQTND